MILKCQHTETESKILKMNDEESTHEIVVSTQEDKKQALKNEGLKC